MDSERTVGREPGGPAASGEEVYRGLRAQILGLDSAGAGLRQGPGHEAVWGALMETGSPRGTASLLGLADGTTSLYLSAGRMSAAASEDDLGRGRHQLSPVFHAAHRVITELRLVDEARRS
jgi:hypothetical protein